MSRKEEQVRAIIGTVVITAGAGLVIAGFWASSIHVGWKLGVTGIIVGIVGISILAQDG